MSDADILSQLPDAQAMWESVVVQVAFAVQQMSMDLMGFQREEMIDYPDMTYCGVAKFLEEAMGSKIQLFL